MKLRICIVRVSSSWTIAPATGRESGPVTMPSTMRMPVSEFSFLANAAQTSAVIANAANSFFRLILTIRFGFQQERYVDTLPFGVHLRHFLFGLKPLGGCADLVFGGDGRDAERELAAIVGDGSRNLQLHLRSVGFIRSNPDLGARQCQTGFVKHGSAHDGIRLDCLLVSSGQTAQSQQQERRKSGVTSTLPLLRRLPPLHPRLRRPRRR